MMNQYITCLKNVLFSTRNVVDSFLESTDSGYLHPFKFILLGALPIIFLNTILIDFPSAGSMNIPDEASQIEQISAWIELATVRLSTQFLPAMLFLLIPLLSISALFFLRNEMEGFYSHLILNSYAAGLAVAALAIAIPFWMFLDISMTDPFMHVTLPAMVVASAVMWVYKEYFAVQSMMGWIRTLSSFITGYFLFIIVKSLFAGITGYLFFAIDRIMELAGI